MSPSRKAEPFVPHAGQVPPDGDWSTWILTGGRGSGMTRAAVEWFLEQVRQGMVRRACLMGVTCEAARAMLIDGASGILACARAGEVESVTSKGRVRFANGATADLAGADCVSILRGPEFDTLLVDSIGDWGPRGIEAMGVAMLGLRLGHARCVITATGNRLGLLPQALAGRHGVVFTSSTTDDNRDHLAPAYLSALRSGM